MLRKKDIELMESLDSRYKEFLESAKNKILSTRILIAKTACQEQISLYWWFGQQIVESQEKYGW